MPVDVQQRADAELGAAWRRCEATVPAGYSVSVSRTVGVRGPYVAVTDYGQPASAYAYADSPAAALDALTEALANR